MKNRIALFLAAAMAAMCASAVPTVTDVVAKQRYPWNELVDITCTVSGINGTTNGLQLAMAAVMPDTGKARSVSHFWVVESGTNSVDREVHTNGNYRLLWDACADLGQVIYSNMVVRVKFDAHEKVQLWEGGPYWATTNIGADEPWEYGYYFWWGDTVGYRRVYGAWVASDGSSSKIQFTDSDPISAQTYGKSISTLLSEGWIVSQGGTYVLAPEHDAAHVKWGGNWRMPTYQEQSDLSNNCDWTWTTKNGVNGYEIHGRGDYASSSIFLPCAGRGYQNLLYDSGSLGRYWSSVPRSGNGNNSWSLVFDSGYHDTAGRYRYRGQTVRPVQGSLLAAAVGSAGDSAPFLLDTVAGAGPRIAREVETIAYSTTWDDSERVCVAVDGVTLKEAVAPASGDVLWNAANAGLGSHALTYTTYKNGVVDKVETVDFLVKETCFVTFAANGGSLETVSSTRLLVRGTVIGELPMPTRTGNVFAGWWTSPSGGTQISGSTSVTGDVTYYAHWAAIAIEDVVVEQRDPWTVDITYTLTGDLAAWVPAWAYLSVTVSNCVDGTTFTADASALSGDTGTAEGVHHVVWDLDAQGLAFEFESDVVFMIEYRHGRETAPYCIVDLSGGPNAGYYPVTYLASPPPGGFNVDEYKTTKLVLRLIEPGVSKTFEDGELQDLTISEPFYCGIFEVTQKQYELVTGDNPSVYKGDMRPVDSVTWIMLRGDVPPYDWPTTKAVDPWSVIGQIQSRTGFAFDLPTDAQWEYACRAGTTSEYNNGGDTEDDLMLLGRYDGNRDDGNGGYSEHTTVGSYQPNAWGLYDMHGNVYEWCLDPVGSYDARVCWGGCWPFSAYFCTLNREGVYIPDTDEWAAVGDDSIYGFRLFATLSNVAHGPTATFRMSAVTFNENGGSLGTADPIRWVTEGAEIGELPTPSRSGYTFDGWFTAAEGGVQVFATTRVSSSVEYYAHWVEIMYTVTFDANGGTGGTSRSVAPGAALGELPAAMLDGYTLAGWFTAANGGTQVSELTVVTCDMIYYAHWTANGGGSGEDPSTGGSATGGGSEGGETGGGTTGSGSEGGETGGGEGTGGEVGGGMVDEWNAGELNINFAKAQTVLGALYGKDGMPVGTVQVKVGKINKKKGTVKISATATVLVNGKTKKVAAKAVDVAAGTAAPHTAVKVAFKAPIGEMAFEMEADGTFTLKNASYVMAEKKVGGKWTRAGARVWVAATSAASPAAAGTAAPHTALPQGTIEELLPDGEPVIPKAGKWSFAKAAGVKWAKPKKGAAQPEIFDEKSGKGLIVDKSKGKTNLSGLKLTYTPKTGIFTGSFNIYAIQGGKLKKVVVKVLGVVVDGKGWGRASGPGGVSFAVTVE